MVLNYKRKVANYVLSLSNFINRIPIGRTLTMLTFLTILAMLLLLLSYE